MTVRLNDKEYKELDEKVEKAGIPKERFLRKLIAGCKVYEAPPVDFKKLIYEINRVGSNIDQILALAYTKDMLDVPRLRGELDELDSIEKAMWAAFAPVR